MRKFNFVLMDLFFKLMLRARGVFASFVFFKSFKKCGSGLKFRGGEFIEVDKGFSVGDNCWIEAVRKYAGENFKPKIVIGKNVCLSDSVHISSVKEIVLGSGVLIGSRVYIGDHSHGSIVGINSEIHLDPALRKLRDSQSIIIGDRVWICDGVVILAGSEIANGSVIAANSVVRLKTTRPSLIGGVPAKVIRYLD